MGETKFEAALPPAIFIVRGETVDFKALLNSEEYAFLHTNPRLGSRIMLLGVSGSYGYGTNREGSDIDFRGVTLNFPSDLIGLTSFDQYEDTATDTVIYSFNKLVNLLLNCNQIGRASCRERV